MNIFEQARHSISRTVIELLFPRGIWKGKEYQILSPLRSDQNVGSFAISEKGLYNDFASHDKGDLITLVHLTYNLSKREAAELIVKTAGGIPETYKAEHSNTKTPTSMPAPESSLSILNSKIENFGRVNNYSSYSFWEYSNEKNELLFAIARFNKRDGSKDIRPYTYTIDGDWVMKQLYKSNRPIHNLPAIINNPNARILIVEGEKAADAARKHLAARGIDDVIVTT